jgi:peptidoglycan/LPS O-acetylase OafA/YrhL
MKVRTTPRIDYLDGMRCVAVVAVMGLHFIYRWAPLHSPEPYPYGQLLRLFLPFRYGALGVDLFFVISGFVITMTLTKCRSPWEFAARRYARLAPAMLLFSTVTFVAERAIPNSPFNSSVWSFAPSVTFVDPRILNLLFSTDRFSSMDGAYWSLYVEVKYYLLAGALYFLNRTAFARNMVLLSTAVLLGYLCCALAAPLVSRAIYLLLIPEFLPWFVLGIGFYQHYSGAARSRWLGTVMAGLLQLLCLGFLHHQSWALAIPALLAACFLAAMHSAALQRLLGAKPVIAVGIASYGLYLLHQNVGLAFIHALPAFPQSHSLGPILEALLTMLGCAVIAYASFILIETPANKALLQWLLRRNRLVAGTRAPPAS